MPDAMTLKVLASVSSAVGLLSILAYLFFLLELRRDETSVKHAIEGEGLFNAKQIVDLLAQFTDDNARLEALKTLAGVDERKATRVLGKIKSNVDLGRLHRLSIGGRLKLLGMSALFFVVLGLLSLAAAYLSRPSSNSEASWPQYVNASQLFNCTARGGKCTGTTVTLDGRVYRRGVIRTQPGEKTGGHSEVSIRVVPGSRYLSFTVGNPILSSYCRADPSKKAMLMYVQFDSEPAPAWEAPVDQVYVDQSVEIPRGAQIVRLIGKTGDGLVDCDDSAWAEVRFDKE